MRILHLLSQIEVTGAEVYAAQLATAQLAAGHQVWIMSDTWRSNTMATYIPLNLHQRTVAKRYKNVLAVRSFIKQHHIDIVNAHSRAATWVGYFATLKMKTPLISTIHGRQTPSLSKRLWNMYGDRVIAVCDNLKQQIMQDIKIAARKLKVIPNGVIFTDDTVPSEKGNVLTIAGRTTGPKGELLSHLLLQVMPKLFAINKNLKIQLIGGKLDELSVAAQQQFKHLQTAYPQRLQQLGFVDNLSAYLAASDCVVASGRVAIEALAQGTPVVAIGEALFVGLIDTDNLAAAIAANFGDMGTRCYPDKIDFNVVTTAIVAGLKLPSLDTAVINTVRQTYTMPAVYQKIMHVYRGAMLEKQHPRHIPILMYHKVLPQADRSRHKIYVTCQQFAQHMQFLAKYRFTPITFKDYFAFRDGDKPLSNFPRKPIIITFDDGYENNLHYALPIMQRYGFKGVLFALGGQIDYNKWDADEGEPRHRLLNAEQLRTMAAAGFEIGAHSLTHPHLPILSSEVADMEITQSKQRLEQWLQQPVISFAYPYGDYNNSIKALVEKAGFTCALATDTGGLMLEDEHFAVFRVNIMPGDYWLQFFKKTSHWYRRYCWHKRGK